MLRAVNVVRSLCLALIVGVLVLHIPLDAFRAKADTCLAASCCETVTVVDACCDACAPEVVVVVEADDAGTPAPKDGCDQGCHCGCCGGLPLVSDVGPSPRIELPGALSSSLDRPGARRARPLEVFHPPRA